MPKKDDKLTLTIGVLMICLTLVIVLFRLLAVGTFSAWFYSVLIIIMLGIAARGLWDKWHEDDQPDEQNQ